MLETTFPFRRIVVIGTSGSGKTTVAQQISTRLDLPHIEFDALHWERGWSHVSNKVMRQRVQQATSSDAWVADGNYSLVRDIVWPRAQALAWLDYPLGLILWQLWWRTWRRALTREVLWGTNVENLQQHFFSRDSLFLWVFQTYWRRKREYPKLISLPEHKHLKVFHFKSPHATRQWLNMLSNHVS